MKIKLLLLYLLFFPALTISCGKYYGVVTHQNKRPYQEDRFVVARHNKAGNFFGIYDGHGGDKTAEFLQNNLHKNFFLEISKHKYRLRLGDYPCPELKEALKKAEDHVLKNYTDGATALAVYISDKNKLNCAWVGDTRLVLEKNGAVGFATTDHKPDNEDELERIVSAGGKIEKWGAWRVGGLAISRSVGDAEIKRNYAGQVIAIPECKKIQLNDDNNFLIMASDGLWDVISSEEAVKTVYAQMLRMLRKQIRFSGNGEGIIHSKDLDEIARYLQDQAIERGSSDNITVCVVYFDWSVQLSIMQQFWNWVRGEK